MALRLILIFFVLPYSATEWYVPFLDATSSQLTLDPWSSWVNQNGNLSAFPYGYAMWFIFLPFILLFKLLMGSIYFGYAFTILLADVALLIVFSKLFISKERLLLIIYWFSPIVLIAGYILGLNDIIPVLLLVLSLYFTRQLKFLLAGIFLALAISAKLSMLLALPFFAIYFLHARALHQLVPFFLKGISIASLLFIFPFLFSTGGIQMLLSNPEMQRVYQFSLFIGKDIYIYIVPLTYLVAIYSAWLVRRMNFELFQSILGIGFLMVVLFSPASPGWFIWALPLLISYQVTSGRVAIILSAIFSILYALSTLIELPEQSFSLISIGTLSFQGLVEVGSHLTSLLHTGMVAIGLILVLRIWRESINRNDFFRLSRKPFSIGIAGDLGSGKSTLSDALRDIFGGHSVAELSGNNYRLWDKQKPILRVMTHLNPMTNDIESFAKDLTSLIDSKSILVKEYDVRTGIMGNYIEKKSNDFIIANALHALYVPLLRESLDLRIYLDIDEDLRRHFRSKTKDLHDSSEYGISSIEDRERNDFKKFIRPQIKHADLILSLQPIHPHMLKEKDNPESLHFKLVVQSRNNLNELSLTKILVGVCGLHVDMISSENGNGVELTIEGETSAEDIALGVKMLCPRVMEFLDINPRWLDGVLGLMQLICLSHIEQMLYRRFK